MVQPSTVLMLFFCLFLLIFSCIPVQGGNLTYIVYWTAPGDDGTVGIASEYDIRISNQPITDANWELAIQCDNEPTPDTAGTAQQYTITGLDPNKIYYVRIKAADEVPNWSPLSNEFIFTTPDTDAPAAITDLRGIL